MPYVAHFIYGRDNLNRYSMDLQGIFSTICNHFNSFTMESEVFTSEVRVIM